jgi:uncharacterized protein (DUF697 family)
VYEQDNNEDDVRDSSYQTVFETQYEEWEQSESTENLKILVCGESRSGKSTLINAAYGKEICDAYGGMSPVTGHPQIVHLADEKLYLIDTRGLELGTNGAKFLKQLSGFQPNLIWLVISWGSPRSWNVVCDTFPGVPVVIVVTKSDWLRRYNMTRCQDTFWFSNPLIKDQPQNIPGPFWTNSVKPTRDDLFNALREYPQIKDFVPVSVFDPENETDIRENPVKPGLPHLFQVSRNILHDYPLLQTIFVKNFNKDNPIGLSVATISTAVAAACGAAWIPIPALDSVAISGIQVAMLTTLFILWDEEVDKNIFMDLLKAVLVVLPTFGIGYGIAQALKFLPYFGTAIGGALAMTVAGGATFLLGCLAVLYLRYGKENRTRGGKEAILDLAQKLISHWKELRGGFESGSLEAMMNEL